MTSTADLAAELVRELAAARETVAVAESLTGGLLAAALTSVPGASAVVRGGVVAYATELKARLAGVPVQTLTGHGAVSAETARAMAAGIRVRCGATYGVATTGVAGPDPAEGHLPGTVHISVAGPAGLRFRSAVVAAAGRDAVRDTTVRLALELLSDTHAASRESSLRGLR